MNTATVAHVCTAASTLRSDVEIALEKRAAGEALSHAYDARKMF